jgi:hypothetical protein
MNKTFNTKQASAGAIFVVVGVFFGVYAAITLDFGTARNMGPGYFPVVLSGLLVVLGLSSLVASLGQEDIERLSVTPWRGIVLITLAPVVFGLLLDGLGLVLSVAAVVLLTAYASVRATLLRSVLLAVAISAFCSLVFHYGLGIPVPLFGDWLSG